MLESVQGRSQKDEGPVAGGFLAFDQFTDGMQRPFAGRVFFSIRHDDGDDLVEAFGLALLIGFVSFAIITSSHVLWFAELAGEKRDFKTLPCPVCRESRWRKLFCFLLGGYIVGRPHTNVVYFSASEGYNGYVDGC